MHGNSRQSAVGMVVYDQVAIPVQIFHIWDVFEWVVLSCNKIQVQIEEEQQIWHWIFTCISPAVKAGGPHWNLESHEYWLNKTSENKKSRTRYSGFYHFHFSQQMLGITMSTFWSIQLRNAYSCVFAAAVRSQETCWTGFRTRWLLMNMYGRHWITIRSFTLQDRTKVTSITKIHKRYCYLLVRLVPVLGWSFNFTRWFVDSLFFPPPSIVWAIFVWTLREKIIRTVLYCSMLCTIVLHNDMHTQCEKFLNFCDGLCLAYFYVFI